MASLFKIYWYFLSQHGTFNFKMRSLKLMILTNFKFEQPECLAVLY